ncbi:hypothetical protein PAECIP111892_01968 [Paenibacillus auburnensis]|uniref:histidine kinase n=1 Tax=Paenibacillus auburnensis TaxID=2905649 RepID=A0ABN8FZ07_9BACL|nr:histidine kinase [Paenibacillus auburnensis]CAH1195144.1 hypothetical protein PAECIP111892_01968 [Paenibacillus auburnensis]
MKIQFLKNISLRTQFIALFILLITMTLGIFGYRYYVISTAVVTDIAEQNAYQIVKKNNDIIDTKLSLIGQNIVAFSNDKELYEAFGTILPGNDEDILKLDHIVSDIIKKYFSHSQDIYSVQLATSYYTFGPTTFYSGEYGKSFIPADALKASRIYQTAEAAKGKIMWIPTYKFAEMFHIQYLDNIKTDYEYMFSAAEMLDGAIINGSVYYTFPEGVEAPVLLVNFKEDFFKNLLEESIPIEGSYYMVLSREGTVISSSDGVEELSSTLNAPWLSQIMKTENGFGTIEIAGRKMIVCYDTSDVTGWISLIAFPQEQLAGTIIGAMRSTLLYWAVFILIIAAVASYWIAGRITNPIRRITRAVNRTGKGDFEVKLPAIGTKEIRILIHNFNLMNERIGTLIEENYEIKLKEKDAEITALNLQLDPHFMYNTLNMISMVALENNQDELSEMIISLSRMLKYTVKNNKDLVLFAEDFAYLEGYIYLMSKRFEGKVEIQLEMDQRILSTTVPKFLMQPFVENVFVHSFRIKRTGKLVIRTEIDNNTRRFIIEDNGDGIAAEKLQEIQHYSGSSVGMLNVQNRIRIIYGGLYGVEVRSVLGQGTSVTISLPYQ